MNSSASAPNHLEPRVPLDIQLAIVEMCPDVRTRLTLVSTHKALRKRGARLAMRLPSARVRLHTESAARSFFAFCSAQGLPREPSSPLALLHTLDVTLATVNLADIGNLITLLANVPVLTSLTLHDPEKALRRQESLYAALQRLRTLQTFRVHEAGAMTFKLVSEIASALEDVAIDPYRKLPIDDDTDELNLSMVLARHKDTLTRVCVWRADVMGNGHRLEGDLVVFEKVRELVIHECVTTGAADCIRVFPNAVSLDVGNNLSTHMKWSAALNHMRLGNFAALLYDGSFGGPDFWPTLERVRGGLLDLYIFGILTCVEALEIDGVVKDDWKRVPSVVQVYKPDILHLAVSSSLQVDVWEKHRSQFDCVGCLVLRFVVEDLVDLKKLTDTAIRAVGSFVDCETVFLDFTAQNDAAHSRLQDFDHLSLRRIVEDPRGPLDLIIRSPVETTSWCFHRDPLGKMWKVRHMPAKTKFETVDCFPEEYVTDWL